MELAQAFKEWAVICEALGEGRQVLILRKGGIAEARGEFTIEHRRFWLFPTYVHQQSSGIKPEAVPLLNGAVVSSNGYSAFNGGISGLPIAPGDSIFVPENFTKGLFIRNMKDIAQILGQFGLAAAAINVLR